MLTLIVEKPSHFSTFDFSTFRFSVAQPKRKDQTPLSRNFIDHQFL